MLKVKVYTKQSKTSATRPQCNIQQGLRNKH